MYFYVYDSFLTDRKHEKTLAEVETRLTDLGISGKIGRLTPFNNAKGLIRDEVRRGVETVVVVGNDETVATVVDGLGDAKVTLGIIPVGAPSEIAAALGIPDGVEACDVLSRRVTQKIDLGSVNGHLFLSQVRLPKGQLTMEGDGKFRISALTTDAETVVSNLRRDALMTESERECLAPGDPQDGFLDALITPKLTKFQRFLKSRRNECLASIIPIRKLSIASDEPIAVDVDGRKVVSGNIAIEVIPQRLKVITGRERVFA
jgi:diacylglycerol kinase family enzyme